MKKEEEEDNNFATDVAIDANGIIFTAGTTSWYVRLWYLISNPFRYIFLGKIKW